MRLRDLSSREWTKYNSVGSARRHTAYLNALEALEPQISEVGEDGVDPDTQILKWRYVCIECQNMI